MRHLGTVADVGVLRLDEAADPAVGAQPGPGPQERERPDLGAGTDLGELRLRAHDARAVVDLDVTQGRVGADDAVAADRARSEDLRARVHDGVGADRHVGVHPRRRGVDDDGALTHGRLDGAAVELGTEPGELDLVVDALGLPDVLDHVGPHRDAPGSGDGDDVGEVLLALRVVGAHLRQDLAQQRAVEGIDAAVDLEDRALLVGRVLLLDDRRDGAFRVAQDATVAGGVREGGRDDRDAAARGFMRSHEGAQRLGAEERHVAVRDDDRAGEARRKGLERALHGATRALDLVLVGDEHVRVMLEHVLGDPVAVVPHDDHEVLGTDPPRRPQGVSHEGAPSDRVQHLGDRGLHACALTSGEDDHGCGPRFAHGRSSFGSDAVGRRPRPGPRSEGRRSHSTRRPPPHPSGCVCRPLGSPGRSRTCVASPDSKSGGPCRQTNRGSSRRVGIGRRRGPLADHHRVVQGSRRPSRRPAGTSGRPRRRAREGRRRAWCGAGGTMVR